MPTLTRATGSAALCLDPSLDRESLFAPPQRYVVRNVVRNVTLCRNDTYERWSASETHKTPQNTTLRALMAVQPPEAKPRPRMHVPSPRRRGVNIGG